MIRCALRSLLGVCFVWLGQPAMAELKFCNKSNAEHSFAVAYKEGGVYKSEGWWNIAPGDCKIVVGGDLKRRYYYMRATAKGRDPAGGGFQFCTTQKPFDIKGDEDCKARGYDESGFRKFDTGETAKSYTLNLVEPKPVASAEPVDEPGRYGEPYSNNVVFQECLSEDNERYCAFHASGIKFYIYEDGRGSESAFNALWGMLPGTPIGVSGDLVEVFDSSAEFVLREVNVRAQAEADIYLQKLQGYWYAVDDPAAQFNILGAERIDHYDGNMGRTEYLSVQDYCEDVSGVGPYLYARDPESGEGLCYLIDYIDEFEMTLMYLPRGNFLQYRKLD